MPYENRNMKPTTPLSTPGTTRDSGVQVLIRWLVTILIPFAIVLTSIRLFLFPAFLAIEYNMPGFPEDRYGFTLQDRLTWAPLAVEYLVNDADISFLGDLRFADGSPVYNERELQHMIDVKMVIQAALNVWYFVLGALALLWVFAWRGGWLEHFYRGVSGGGWLTAVLLGALIVFVALSFSVFFVTFHNMFFKPGTWIFYYSDTLIRLFPQRFWQDIAIYIGLLSMGLGVGLGVLFRAKKPR